MAFRTKKPARRLVIKDFKVVPTLPENFLEDTWAKISASVASILSGTAGTGTESKETLYRAVTDLCAHKQEALMYKRLLLQVDEHLAGIAAELLSKSSLQRSDSYSEQTFLQVVQKTWSEYCTQMRMIRNIFLHLDRTFVLAAGRDSALFAKTELPAKFAGIRSLWSMGITLFRMRLFSASPDFLTVSGSGDIYERTAVGVLSLVEEERRGATVTKSLIRDIVRIFSSAGIYGGRGGAGMKAERRRQEGEGRGERDRGSGMFEEQLLKEADAFYEVEGREKTTELTCAEYLAHVTTRLAEEEARVAACLQPSTRDALLAIVRHHLIISRVDFLTDMKAGAGHLLADGRVAELAVLYRLLQDVKLLEPLCRTVFGYFKSTGQEHVRAHSGTQEAIEKLIALKSFGDQLLVSSFADDSHFKSALKESFKAIVNVEKSNVAELLASYVDSKLRSGNKCLSESELEAVMDQVVYLFRYVENKDVFQAFFRARLSKRLLLGKSAGMDMEKAMIGKLKQECGATYTKKLEAMFTDMNLSRDLMAAYRMHCEAQEKAKEKAGVDITVLVLTMGVWPTFPPSTLLISAELSALQGHFLEFYKAKYPKRQLTWQHAMGYCTVAARFPQGGKLLDLSQYQAAVVTLFNTTSKLSLEEISSLCGLQDDVLKSTMQSLACGKARVLVKVPKGREVNGGDVFYFNKNFSSKMYRIRVNQIQIKETKEERDKTEKHILVERGMQVDAAVVRIMKSRKTLNHQLLVAEIIQQLRFKVELRMVKQRIESLIEREYLERDEADDKLYRYLA